MLARPLAEVGGAARRIAAGDYAARVPREGPEEIASLADSFNQMAASLERQEAMRRDFIANAAHELRTPLTNLQGYLEALRDGVITADRATYDRSGRRPSGWSACRAHSTRWPKATPADRPPSTSRPVAAIRMALDLAGPTLERAGLRLVDSTCPTGCRHAPTPTSLPRSSRNLLQNAVRYTPSGGTVTVRAERRPADLLVSSQHRRRHPTRTT